MDTLSKVNENCKSADDRRNSRTPDERLEPESKSEVASRKAQMAILVEVWRLAWLGDDTLRPRELRAIGAHEFFFNREMGFGFASQKSMAKAVNMPIRTFKRAMAAIRGRYVASNRQKTGAINHTILCIPPDAEARIHQGATWLPLARDKQRGKLQQKAREIAIETLLAAHPGVSSNLAPARANILAPARATQGGPSNTSDSTSDFTSVLTAPIGIGAEEEIKKRKKEVGEEAREPFVSATTIPPLKEFYRVDRKLEGAQGAALVAAAFERGASESDVWECLCEARANPERSLREILTELEEFKTCRT